VDSHPSLITVGQNTYLATPPQSRTASLQSRYPIPPLVSGCASTCTSLPYKLNSSILPLGCVLPFLFFPFQPWSSNSKEKNSLTVIVEYQLPTFCPSSISHRPIKHPNSFLFRGQLLCSCSSLHRALSNQHQSISLTCMCLLFPWSFLCPPPIPVLVTPMASMPTQSNQHICYLPILEFITPILPKDLCSTSRPHSITAGHYPPKARIQSLFSTLVNSRHCSHPAPARPYPNIARTIA
jgi:hypothetical protein